MPTGSPESTKCLSVLVPESLWLAVRGCVDAKRALGWSHWTLRDFVETALLDRIAAERILGPNASGYGRPKSAREWRRLRRNATRRRLKRSAPSVLRVGR